MPNRSKPGLLARLGSVRRRWWAVLAAVAVIAGAGSWFALARGQTNSDTQAITSTVSRGTYKTTVSATGTITPKRDKTLTFTSAGTVTAVEASVGEKVQKGDVLARIGDSALVAQRDAASAQVSAAESQLSGDSGGTATQIAADEASLASAKSQLAGAQAAVDNATLRAPFAGTVSAVDYAVGDTVGGSGNNSPAASSGSGTTTGITVISPHTLLVDADVSAADVSQLKTGMQATITPTGGADIAYGTVSAVGVIASASDTGAAQFPVTIAVTGTPTGLYPGASASVAITVKQATNVLAVPTQALHTSGNSVYVYLVNGSTRTKRTVTVGTAYGAETQVLSGLKAGDVVEVISFTRPRTSGGTRNGNGGTFTFPGGNLPGGGNFPDGGTFTGGGAFPGGPGGNG